MQIYLQIVIGTEFEVDHASLVNNEHSYSLKHGKPVFQQFLDSWVQAFDSFFLFFWAFSISSSYG